MYVRSVPRAGRIIIVYSTQCPQSASPQAGGLWQRTPALRVEMQTLDEVEHRGIIEEL